MSRAGAWVSRVFLVVLWAFALNVEYARGEEKEPSHSYFPIPKSIRPQVDFWKKIFAVYSRYQVVIHDTETMQIYRVLDFRRLRDDEELDEATVNQIRQDQTKLEMAQIRSVLTKLQGCVDGLESCDNLDPEEKKIWNLFKGNTDVDRFRAAAGEDRLRTQTGVRERFREGVQNSRRYLKAMEEIFQREGVPVELTRLPLVESSFNLKATSKVGAAGIWQFMPSTGRLYDMQVSSAIDERRDPLIATEAAARFLKSNYERLGAWPLAITAYNHGPGGVATAINTVGSRDIGDIVRLYRGKNFGFASRNFYTEFLAALDVERNHKKHFGALEMDAPLAYDEISLESPLSLSRVAEFVGVESDEIRNLNPALGSPIREGSSPIPRGYQLRLPSGTYTTFQQRYSAWQDEEQARIAAAERARQERVEAARRAQEERRAAWRAKRSTLVRATVSKSRRRGG
ncbi:MAG: lytic transglycosylase domain-containing protein [Deltaproteobacteria bacterium]|nr:lytic transglycosylase domain-containing protein [Deltaproteobacteria bacterium]